MPYKSKSQAAYFNIHRAELEKKGINVEHWNKESKGLDLPDHIKPHGSSGNYLKHLYRNRKK